MTLTDDDVMEMIRQTLGYVIVLSRNLHFTAKHIFQNLEFFKINLSLFGTIIFSSLALLVCFSSNFLQFLYVGLSHFVCCTVDWGFEGKNGAKFET